MHARMNHTRTTHNRGFALLVSIIFMSVMLSLGLALSSIGYKQSVLASTSIDSQYAFYAADSALECALYADQQQHLFAYNADLNASAPAMTCNGAAPVSVVTVSHTETQWVTRTRLSIDSGARCADITLYKPADGADTTHLFSQGYSASCDAVANAASTNARFSARGLEAHY